MSHSNSLSYTIFLLFSHVIYLPFSFHPIYLSSIISLSLSFSLYIYIYLSLFLILSLYFSLFPFHLSLTALSSPFKVSHNFCHTLTLFLSLSSPLLLSLSLFLFCYLSISFFPLLYSDATLDVQRKNFSNKMHSLPGKILIER